MTKNNSERDTEVIQMLKAGMKAASVAAEMGVSEATVRRIGSTAGINAHPREAGSSELAVIEAYKSGVSIKSILGEHNLSYSQLYGILYRNDVPVRLVTNQNARVRQLDEAIEMYKQGLPIRDIVEATGVSQPTLHNEIHDRKIPLRRPRK